MKRSIIITLICACAALSCNKIAEVGPANDAVRDGIAIEVLCDDCSGGAATKSSFSSSALTKVNNVNIWIYSDGILDEAHSGYFSPASGISISFPSYDRSYDIYMLANVGNVTPPADEEELAGWMYRFNDYGNFESAGFPMANSFLNYRPGDQTTFRIKRLVGEYVIRFEDSSSMMDHTIRSVQLKNCALQVGPFSDGTCCTSVIEFGDHLSAADIATLNNGGEVSLYFLENLQGVLLPSNTDPKKKTPDYILDQRKQQNCTYIEVDTEVDTPTAHYESVRYRAYLGQDMTSDFNIRRSTRYYLDLNFESNMVQEEEWRIEPEDPEIVGTLKWKTREVYAMKTPSSADDPILEVICPNTSLSYTVTLDEAEARDAQLTMTRSAAGKYTCHTTHPIDAYAPSIASGQKAAPKDVHVYLKSYDGLISDTAVIHVIHHAYPVYIYYTATDALYAEAWHPMGLQLEFQDIRCTVTGEGHYQKSGIAGDSWQTASETGNWNIPKYAVSTSNTSDFKKNIDQTSTFSTRNVISKIESHTVLYDNTWLGTNKKYYPMHPTSLTMDMKIYAYTPSGSRIGDITSPLNSGCPFYILNEPDYTIWNGTFYKYDASFTSTHTGTVEVFLAGNDMQVKYAHSNGTTYGFYNGGTMVWKEQYVTGGTLNYNITSTGSGGGVATPVGDRPRPITLNIYNGSAYTTKWTGGSGYYNTR